MAQVNDLRKPSPLMGSLMNQLNLMRNAFEGGAAFKRVVLIKKPTEAPALYTDKLNNVSVLPICKSMISELTDIIFSEEPTRNEAFLTQAKQPLSTAPLWFDDFLQNADLQGNELTQFMEKVAINAAVEGWVWVAVDLPEEQNATNRPYLTMIPAQHVIDWKVLQEDGITTLTYLKVIEYQTDQIQCVKIWELGCVGGVDDDGDVEEARPTTATCYEIPMLGGTPTVAVLEPSDVYEFPPDYPIPYYQFMPEPDIRNSMIGVSDLTDISDLQREWLRLEAEAYDSIRFSKPIVRVDQGLKVPAGGGGIVHGPKDCMEVHAIPVMDVDQIRLHQQALCTQFDGYTGRLGTRNVSEQVQSGISIVEERKSLHKKAEARARKIERAEENILEMVCYMMGLNWVGEVEYSSDYSSRDTQYKLALLNQAKILSPTNPVIQTIIDLEVIKMISPPNELVSYLQLVGKVGMDTENTLPKDDDTDSEQMGRDQNVGKPDNMSRSSQMMSDSAGLKNMSIGIITKQ